MFLSSCRIVIRNRNVSSAKVLGIGRNASTVNVNAIENPIVLTDDGTTIVCWHPEKEFPYECTRPMPQVSSKEIGVLKTTKEEAMNYFQKKRPENEIREQLAKMTHTTVHRWFPRSRDKKAKKTPADRPHL